MNSSGQVAEATRPPRAPRTNPLPSLLDGVALSHQRLPSTRFQWYFDERRSTPRHTMVSLIGIAEFC